MPHNNHTTSVWNRDLSDDKTIDYYLNLARDWTDPLPPPIVETIRHPISNTPHVVVREDLVEGGTKRRFGDLLIRSTKAKHIVYVAPRYGHAGIALALLCKTYKKQLTLFMPACVTISPNQARAIELGARPVFYRIAAMPNLNIAAKAFADRVGGFFVPLGLKHELVTAAAVKVASQMFTPNKVPKEVWTAISTGVLSRALQIAWGPNKRRVVGPDFRAVAVSRNIQDGEKGYAQLYSHHRAFVQDAQTQPPFPSASNYDAKVWEYMAANLAAKGALFWNVANNEAPRSNRWYDIESNAPWGITRVFNEKVTFYDDIDFSTNTIHNKAPSTLAP
jgi:hypothetical protein